MISISEAKIFKASTPVTQLHTRKRLEIALCLKFLRYFHFKLEIYVLEFLLKFNSKLYCNK